MATIRTIMPRYFFQVQDGRDIQDDEGIELTNLDEAKVEALRFAGSLLHKLRTAFWVGDEWTIDVTDQAGEVLLTVGFQFSLGICA